jgi:lipoprotein-anchoring transpeptidase ErfK/SrfK
MEATMGATRDRRTVLALLLVGSVLSATPVAAQPRTDPAQAAPVSRRIVVSIPDRKLALIENDVVVLVLPVAIGAPGTPSPVGTFEIANRLSNPTYYGHRQVIEPGPSNPLGTRWIGLNAKGYGIHGTDAPRSIGHAKSHGCIRLRNADVETLFARVRVGDVVELRGERTPDTERIFAN